MAHSATLTPLTVLSAKDVQSLNPARSLRWCQEQLAKARQAAGAGAALLCHLASFWAVPDSDLMAALRPRFTV